MFQNKLTVVIKLISDDSQVPTFVSGISAILRFTNLNNIDYSYSQFYNSITDYLLPSESLIIIYSTL